MQAVGTENGVIRNVTSIALTATGTAGYVRSVFQEDMEKNVRKHVKRTAKTQFAI